MIPRRMVESGHKGSTIREMAAYGAARAAVVGEENVFNFTIGTPSVDPPKEVIDCMERLLRTMPSSLLHAYVPEPGIASVREKLAAYLKETYGAPYRAEDLFLTSGSSSALAILAKALLSPGDEVMVLAPYFLDYRTYIYDRDAVLVEVPCEKDTFRLDLAAIEAALTEKTAAIILNTPNNPTGVVLGDGELRAFADLLRRKEEEYGHAIYLIADEPYRELVYDGVDVPFTPHYYNNTIYCYSFSKSLSLPGERIGFIALNPEMTDYGDARSAVYGAGRALGYVCMPPLFQYMVAECVGLTSDFSVYRENRDLLYEGLTGAGFSCVKPEGAFYLFLRSPEEDDRAFCRRCMEHDLLMVPGSDFGCSGYARIAYCVSREQVERSLPVFRRIAEEYGLC